MASANSSATSFQMPARMPPRRVIQATTPSMMSLETQSMASGSSARRRRKTVLAITKGGLVSHTIRNSGLIFRSDARRARQESSCAGRGGLGSCMSEF